MRRFIGKTAIKLAGWKSVGEEPVKDHVSVLVAAPHTSGWDFPLMLMSAWAYGISPSFLAKKELFEGPLGIIMRATGGIPVDRQNPQGLVDELVRRATAGDALALVIPAEGTRKLKTYWKSGFYRIATQAQVPFTLTYVDGPSKTLGFGPTIMPSGDVVADMDKVRAFYDGKLGIKPELTTPPRLREEDAVHGAAGEAKPEETES